MNIFGAYTSEPNVTIDSSLFLELNTKLLLNLMDKPPQKCHISLQKFTPLQAVAVGIPTNPIRKNGQPIHPECDIVVTYNAQILLERLQGSSPNQAFGLLWGTIARALRLFCLVSGRISKEEMLPLKIWSNLFPQRGADILVEGYEMENWSEERTLTEVDTSIISTSVGVRAVIESYRPGRLEAPKLAQIIEKTTRSNWEALLPM